MLLGKKPVDYTAVVVAAQKSSFDFPHMYSDLTLP